MGRLRKLTAGEAERRKREYLAKYYQRPEVKEKVRIYQSKPEIKQRRKEYKQIPNLKKFYQGKLLQTLEKISKYPVPPIALEGKAIMLQEILDNLEIIKEHTKNMDVSVKYKTIQVMIDQLLEKEGLLVSQRKSLPSNFGEGEIIEW